MFLIKDYWWCSLASGRHSSRLHLFHLLIFLQLAKNRVIFWKNEYIPDPDFIYRSNVKAWRKQRNNRVQNSESHCITAPTHEQSSLYSLKCVQRWEYTKGRHLRLEENNSNSLNANTGGAWQYYHLRLCYVFNVFLNWDVLTCFNPFICPSSHAGI